MIGASLLRYDNNQKYALFDAESFSLNLLADNPPWQFSWLVATKDKILESQDHYLNWNDRFKISRGAAIVTGYSDYTIKSKGEDPAKVWDSFQPVLNDKNIILCGHNIASFDFYIIKQWAKYLGKEFDVSTIITRFLDTNCLAKMIKLNLKPDLNQFITQQYKLTGFHQKGMKTSLSTMAKELGVEVNETKLHNAAYDLEINYQVLKAFLWKIEI